MTNLLISQELERPFIWVKQSVRNQILEKIAAEKRDKHGHHHLL